MHNVGGREKEYSRPIQWTMTIKSQTRKQKMLGELSKVLYFPLISKCYSTQEVNFRFEMSIYFIFAGLENYK